MRSNVPDETTPGAQDPSARRPRRIVIVAGVAVLTVAAAGFGVLLRDTARTDEGSPVPASATSTTPNADESYLRQVCGDDLDLTSEAGLCLGHTSMSPSDVAKILDDLEQNASREAQ